MAWSEFRRTGLTHRDSRFAGGYTIITPIGGNSTYLLDEDRRIVYGWTPLVFQPGYGYLLPGGHLLVRGQPLGDTEVGPGQPAGTADILLELDWEGNVVWRWEHSAFHHDMCRLPNGNLVCEGQSGRVFEVTPDCEICWEWISSFVFPFKGVMASMLFRAHRYAADSPELRGQDLDAAGYEELNRKLGLAK